MDREFYEWLNRKYGWSKADYTKMESGDPEFADDLVKEYYAAFDRYGKNNV